MRHIHLDLTAEERDALVRVLEEELGALQPRQRDSGKSLGTEQAADDSLLRELLGKLMHAHPQLGI